MADTKSPSFSASSRITTQYQQSVSRFLFYSDSKLQEHRHFPDKNSHTSWVGDTARSLALRAAAPVLADEHIPNKSKTAKCKTKGVSAVDVLVRTLTASSNWSDCICMTCGTLTCPPIVPAAIATDSVVDTEKDTSYSITPSSISTAMKLTIQEMKISPASNVYLRPMKRGRTRRRRASRSKAKQLQNQSLSLQRRGGVGAYNHTNGQVRKEALAKEAMQRLASSHRVGDGRAKNCVVVRCTFCGTKKKRKGVELESKNPKKGGRRSDGGGKRRESQRESMSNTAEKNKSIAAQIRDNSDFISLSSMGRGARVEQKSVHEQQHESRQTYVKKRNQEDTSDAFTSPLLTGKKKKRKKKNPDTKKGDLMNFLSSLND